MVVATEAAAATVEVAAAAREVVTMASEAVMEAVEAAMTLAPESALYATAALVATVVNRTGGHGMPVGP